MAHAPGSFSKNFAWHGTGLRKLHSAIKSGFQSRLVSVERQAFRRECRLVGGIDLIPINFFLHNKHDYLSVDELVYRAIKHPHGAHFDKLALFTFHLNRVGSGSDPLSGRKIVSRPAMWANEFVRKRLWSGGAWQTDALSDAALDSFLEHHMSAQTNVRVKCRNNYRHMFTLCKYWPSELPIVNTSGGEWGLSAFFVAWDRHTLDGGDAGKLALLDLVDHDDLHKLLGIGKNTARQLAARFVDLYMNAGGIERLSVEVSHRSASKTTEQNGAMEEAWLEQAGSDEAVERHAVERMELSRDRRLAVHLKTLYDNTCMFCGAKLQISPNTFYSEASHIRPLGTPHNGPDKAGNMLILCPNHHLQFDRGSLGLRKDGRYYKVLSKIPGDPINGKTIDLRHRLDDDCIDWHSIWFGSERD